MLIISFLGIITFVIFNAIKLKLFKSHLFSNVVKLMSFISDAHYYIPVKVCRTADSTHLLKKTGILYP